MRPAAPARESARRRRPPSKAPVRAIHLRLRAGDERGQTVDAAGVGNHGLRLAAAADIAAADGARVRGDARAAAGRALIGLVFARADVALRLLSRGTKGCCCCGTKPGSWPKFEKFSPSSSPSSVAGCISLSVRGCGWFCRNCSWAAAIRRK